MKRKGKRPQSLRKHSVNQKKSGTTYKSTKRSNKVVNQSLFKKLSSALRPTQKKAKVAPKKPDATKHVSSSLAEKKQTHTANTITKTVEVTATVSKSNARLSKQSGSDKNSFLTGSATVVSINNDAFICPFTEDCIKKNQLIEDSVIVHVEYW